MWNVNSSIVNTRPLEVLIIKVCHCVFWFICSQHAIEMDLVSQKAPKNPVVGRLTSDRLSTIDYIIIYVDHEYCNVKCYVY